MSNRRKQELITAAATKAGAFHSSSPIQTGDSFQNLLAKVGLGTGNQNDASRYGFNPVTRNRLQMEWVYRGSWVAGRAIDCIAQDMTREGVDIESTMQPTDIKLLEREAKRLQIWPALSETISWARLYGGAVAYLMIDGQNPKTPLRIETLAKDQFKGLMPMDRWMLNPSMGELIQEYGPNIGLPMYYTTVPDTTGMPIMKIHHSRLIRLEGVKLPYWQKQTENLWGQSVLERLWDRLIAYDSTTSGAAQLVYKAHLRTLSIDGLRDIIGTGGPALDGLAKNIEMIRALQTNEGITIIDAKDTFETHQYAFSGLDKLLLSFGDQICGALEIPRTRLFGESAGGLNSNGEGESKDYKESIKQQQVAKLGPGIQKLYSIVHINKFGAVPPEDFAVDFRSLEQLNEPDAADVVNKTTASIIAAFEAGIIKRATALRELKQLSKSTGAYSNITDEEINEAENDPAPSPEALGLVVPKPADNGPGEKGSKGQPGKTKDGDSIPRLRAVT